jgi:hypothetical protein
MANKSRWRGALRAAFLAFTLSIGWSGPAASFDAGKYQVQIAVDESEAGRTIAGALQKKFPTALVIRGVKPSTPHNQEIIYLAAGPVALRALLRQGVEGVIVSLFTSSQLYT